VKESQIQRAIMDLLAAERIPAWRMNSGVMAGEHKGKKRFVRFGEKGMADILAAPRGPRNPITGYYGSRLFLWIEVKTATGVVSDEQISFHHHVIGNGMNYIVARSVDDVIEWLRRNK
jgi:hypothetical protein